MNGNRIQLCLRGVNREIYGLMYNCPAPAAMPVKREGPYQDRKLIIGSLCRKAGARYFRFRALRHTGASIMDTSNVPIGPTQKILGHENRTTTEIYLHSIGDAERVAISAYEQARQKSHTNSYTEQKGITAEKL